MITINRILCPVDFFPASDAAVRYAAGLASNYDATVHLLHVITPIVLAPYEYAIDTAEIMKSLEQPGTYTGVYPFSSHPRWLKNAAHLRQLDKLVERVRELEDRLDKEQRKPS